MEAALLAPPSHHWLGFPASFFLGSLTPVAKPVIFSGLQSSGVPQLGNYLGAIKNWVRLQEKPESTIFYSVVGTAVELLTSLTILAELRHSICPLERPALDHCKARPAAAEATNS
eukprot:m.142438 g.142438  ORF g.142438 m.142438 type:complete len:115 (-) comp52617_c0_seq3:917-1261(-)